MTSHQKPRQAVVVIHGIGEQRPMQTLRGFADSVLVALKGGGRKYWSKPDRMSDSYELRRLKAPGDRHQPGTDLFEYYWAYHMRDTKARQVRAWILKMLFTRPTPRLRGAWIASWVSALLTVAFLVTGVVSRFVAPALGLLQGFSAAGLLVALVGSYFSNKWLFVIGDAARYLDPTADNVVARETVRRKGVELLRRLHECGKYHRIIVVGHSLGSVIAYDVLRFAWEDFRGSYKYPPDNVGQKALQRLERAAARLEAASPNEVEDARREFRVCQRGLWLELRRLGCGWLVTDLVTIGSPLAHAPFLISECAEEFSELKSDEGLPMCPPVRQKDGHCSYPGHFKFDVGARSMRVLTPGAMLSCVRWTNVYYPGDIIGGPVAPHFGQGVRDWETELRGGWWWHLVTRLPLAHTKYWGIDGGKPGKERPDAMAVTKIRNGMQLSQMRLMADSLILSQPVPPPPGATTQTPVSKQAPLPVSTPPSTPAGAVASGP